MEKLILVSFLVQVFSYNLLNLGLDLGIIVPKSLSKINPAAEYSRLRILDIKSLDYQNSKVLEIYTCYNGTEIQKVFNKDVINKILSSLESFSTKSECIMFLFMLNSINYLQDERLSNFYDIYYHQSENIFLQNCNARSYSQALALYKYFSDNTDREDMINIVYKIFSLYNFENLIEGNYDYHTKIHLFTFIDCDESRKASYSYLETFICWVEHLLSYKFSFTKNLFDWFLKTLDIKKPNCEAYKVGIEKIIEIYFPDAYKKYKDCADYIHLLKAVTNISGIEVSEIVWKTLIMIKDGVKILPWPFS